MTTALLEKETEQREKVTCIASDIVDVANDLLDQAADVVRWAERPNNVNHTEFVAQLETAIKTLTDLQESYQRTSKGLDVDYSDYWSSY